MKKLLFSILLILPFGAANRTYAEEIPNDEIWYWSSYSSTVTPYNEGAFGANIISNTVSGGKGIIKFDGPVTSIGKNAFQYCSSLSSIEIPNSVTSICENAFSQSSLDYLRIPNSVTSIGNNAFYYCSLDSIYIPNSVTEIGASAFSCCNNLLFVSIPNSVKNIGSEAFYYCSSLIYVSLPDSITKIEDKVFRSCRNLMVVEIPYCVTSIGYEAFCDCESLDSISIPNSVKEIEEQAFEGCSSLRKINIPNSITTIEQSLFYGCSNLQNIVVPNSVTTIESLAFAYCSSLKSVTLGNSVTTLSYGAFKNCTDLSSINLPNSITSIDGTVFDGCVSLPVIDYLRYADIYLIEVVDNTRNSYTIKDGTKWMASGIFKNCSNLESITIPNSVVSISANAFEDCTNLVSVHLGNSVEEIQSSAFRNCSSLNVINLPNSIQRIGGDNKGYAVFKGCTSLPVENGLRYADTYLVGVADSTLESYTIKEGTKWIGEYAINDCLNLKYINLPSSVQYIEYCAFLDCQNLTSIIIPKNVISLGYGAFSGCYLREVECQSANPPTGGEFSTPTYQHAPLFVPVGSFDSYAFNINWCHFNIIKEQALDTTELNTKQVYALKNRATRGYMVYDIVNDKAKEQSLTSAMDDESLSQHWQIVQAKSGQKYLYNLGAKKYAYVQADGQFVMSDTPVAITITNNDKGIQLGHQGQWSFVLNNTLAISDVVGINDVDADGDADGEIYNLAGQKLQKLQKGLNIINGKKVLF